MRLFVLFLTLLFGSSAAVIAWMNSRSDQVADSIWMVTAVGLTRLTLVMAALWLAWPAVRRPAMWLPSGMLAVVFVVFAVCVVRPQLAIALIPAVSLLIAFSAFLRFIREA